MIRRKRIREEAKKLNPIDDLMFRKLAEDKEFCQEMLRIILEDDGLVVVEAIPQWTGTNLQGRSVILDARCITGEGSQVNVEVQKANDDNHQKRVRYNGAVLTTNDLLMVPYMTSGFQRRPRGSAGTRRRKEDWTLCVRSWKGLQSRNGKKAGKTGN